MEKKNVPFCALSSSDDGDGAALNANEGVNWNLNSEKRLEDSDLIRVFFVKWMA